MRSARVVRYSSWNLTCFPLFWIQQQQQFISRFLLKKLAQMNPNRTDSTYLTQTSFLRVFMTEMQDLYIQYLVYTSHTSTYTRAHHRPRSLWRTHIVQRVPVERASNTCRFIRTQTHTLLWTCAYVYAVNLHESKKAQLLGARWARIHSHWHRKNTLKWIRLHTCVVHTLYIYSHSALASEVQYARIHIWPNRLVQFLCVVFISLFLFFLNRTNLAHIRCFFSASTYAMLLQWYAIHTRARALASVRQMFAESIQNYKYCLSK